MATTGLLDKVKKNLILNHSEDDALITGYISAAVSYAEGFQHLDAGYYQAHDIPATTEQAIIMLSTHFYESRDGGSGGFFADNTAAVSKTMEVVHTLLRIDKEWKV